MGTTIGVISDTHGLLRPEVFDLFRDVELIIHSGDIGPQSILTELEAIAPVHAVYGNTDRFPLVERLPERKSLRISQVRLFVTHQGGSPEQMRLRYPEIQQSDLVIFGHTHRPLHIKDQGVIFFNPGSAGPRRFSLPVTVGKVEINHSEISLQVVDISSS